MQDVTIDDKSYIMATLPSNVDHEVPTIGFVSHFDTTPDFTGANVKPLSQIMTAKILSYMEQNIILSPIISKNYRNTKDKH
jgi:tripeptide aminopeptidase